MKTKASRIPAFFQKTLKQKWLKSGLFWALFMYSYTCFLYPLIKHNELSTTKLLIGIPIWLVTGFAFGYIIKYLMNKKAKRNPNRSNL